MRAQSLRAASRCENAKGKVCHCRCGGKLHGAMRHLIEEGREVPGYFEALPESDPHHVPDAEEQKRRRRMKNAEKKARGQGRLWAIFTEEEDDDGSLPPQAA